ncbi:hypothetical protein Tco_0925753 [Tanacetum coccineum]|uniref:Uncharacterized protein n=1 Tax=Tanacetum coccineum TaxID=301880 RepID=A0ABQ5DET1_9ASTR
MAEEQAIVYAPQWGNMTNYLREFWSTAIAYDPFPSTDETEQHPLREFLIKFSVLNGQRPSTLDFNTFCSSTGLDYNNGKFVAHPTPKVLSRNYSYTEQVNSIQQLLAYYLITRTESEGLSVSTFFVPKEKEREVLDYTQGNQGNTTPKPTEDSEQSHSVSLGTVPDSQDLERNIQLASTGLPSTLDEGTRKSQPLLVSTTIDPKDSVGNKQPIDTGLPSTVSDEGTAKTMLRPEGPLGDKDSGGNMSPVDMEPINPTVADLSGTGAKYQVDQTQSTRLSEEDILGAGEEVDEDPQAAEVQHQSSPLLGLERAQNHIQSSMSSLKEDTLSIKSMMTEMYEVFKGQSSSAPSGSVTPTLALTYIPANIEGENETNTTTKVPPSYTEGETDANKQEKPKEPKHSTDANIEFIGSSTQPSITQAQLITIINPEPIVQQREGKGIATDEQVEDQRKLVKASSIVHPNPDAPILVPYMINGKLFHLTAEQIEAHLDKEEKIRKAEEEARLIAINNPEVIKLVREEAKKLGIHPKEAITAKAGTDGRTFDVHNPFAFGDFGISELDELREIIPKKKNVVVKDLMNFLSRRYKSFKKIPEELEIPSALPALVPE